MIEAGSLRLCPICDAYKLIGKRVAVFDPADDAMKKRCSCERTPNTSPCW
ncbi:hypothetical protein [Mesorhizobium escarrei]|uniref:Uncharacterized protein n=1 Tax=Mesorhizobium escarrei TaxID=666018 RepID=A0ABN8KGE7_9HYPH|nr:hypothetical protein [Mesorhizobium escarrei]CAH2408261.1 hypothetical protein MES5069_670005 [Mesorhizobium escarrei]